MRSLAVTKSLLEEFLFIVKFHAIAPFVRPEPPSSWRRGKKNVILIQGINSTFHGLETIGNRLNQKGYKIHTLKSLGKNTGSIKKASKILENYLEENKLSNVILVCHSKGGIIARYFLENSKIDYKIKKVFTIASPHKGILLNFLVNKHHLIANSNIKGRIINLYPTIDNVVMQGQNLILSGAKNIRINIVGHNKILGSEQTIKVILDRLKRK